MLWEKEKLLITSNFSSHCVFKRLVSQGRQKVSLCGNGLSVNSFQLAQSECCVCIVAEILELAGNAARDNKKTRVSPRHILLAVANDEELHQVCLYVLSCP